MKAVKIQHSKTREIISYYINNKKVSSSRYNEEVNRHLKQKAGCYNLSTTNKTRSGNFRHTAYYSI